MSSLLIQENSIFHKPLLTIPFSSDHSSLFACGKNDFGELSFNHLEFVSLPSGISFALKNPIVFVACKGNHTGFLTEEGDVYFVGSTLCGKLGFISS
jgi:alpha-tubulin suppressor-like RCC1 family protein